MNELDYKIISKNQITVVTFKGRMSKDTTLQMETCRKEINSQSSLLIVICFKDFSTIDPAAYREFALLQQDIRKKRVEFYMVGLDQKLKQLLIDKALIRMAEIKKSLSEVLEQKKTA